MDAQYENFIFSYEDYNKESNVWRNCRTSSARITMAIYTSDARNALRKLQQMRNHRNCRLFRLWKRALFAENL